MSVAHSLVHPRRKRRRQAAAFGQAGNDQVIMAFAGQTHHLGAHIAAQRENRQLPAEPFGLFAVMGQGGR